MGEEDVARHTHSARQTDDSEEDEKDHFETTKKKNPKTLERHRRQSANRYRHHLESKSSSSSSSSSALKTSRFIIIIIMPSEDQQQQQQQQQQHRSTARRDQLTAYQTSAQASWSTSKAFEVNADKEKTIKFFGNFPYPYMNGLLHLGHAFSLSKLVRLNVHEHYSLSEPRSKEKEDALASSKHSSGWSGMGWRTLFSMTR